MAEGRVVAELPPVPADRIISGGQLVSNSTTSTVVITIPAGRTWVGTVSVCAANNQTTAAMQNSRVVVVGTGAVPAATTPLAVAISWRDTAPGVMTVPNVYVVAPAGNAVTLELVNSTATAYSGSAVCAGYLLP